MDREGGSNRSCYYSILGIRKGSSFSEIRSAYRKLALVSFCLCFFDWLIVNFENVLMIEFVVVVKKWHPDRWGTKNPKGSGEAKRRFQQIQEAYSGNLIREEEIRRFSISKKWKTLDLIQLDFAEFWFLHTVLSDKGKRSIYDAGLYDPFEEEEEEVCNLSLSLF